MKLLIYETTHHETLPAILDLSLGYFEETTVFLTESSYNHLCSGRRPEDHWPRTIFVTQNKDSNRGFIKKAFAFLTEKKYSHFHISTLDHNLLYLTAKIFPLRKINISISIQAINEYCHFKLRGFRDLTESAAKLYLHKRVKHYRVFSPLMAEVFRQKLEWSTCVFIPSRFFSPAGLMQNKKHAFYKIVIPGSVDPNRRDYDFVLQALELLLAGTGDKQDLELVVLGNSSNEYGRDIISRLKAFESPHFRITYYDGYISQSEYELQLSEADIIWGPIHTKTIFKNTDEVYGTSTATGLTGDLLLNDTPALVPADFTIPQHYEDALIPYHSVAGSVELLQTLMKENVEMENRRRRIRAGFSFFAREHFTSSFEILMNINETAGRH